MFAFVSNRTIEMSRGKRDRSQGTPYDGSLGRNLPYHYYEPSGCGGVPPDDNSSGSMPYSHGRRTQEGYVGKGEEREDVNYDGEEVFSQKRSRRGGGRGARGGGRGGSSGGYESGRNAMYSMGLPPNQLKEDGYDALQYSNIHVVPSNRFNLSSNRRYPYRGNRSSNRGYYRDGPYHRGYRNRGGSNQSQLTVPAVDLSSTTASTAPHSTDTMDTSTSLFSSDPAGGLPASVNTTLPGDRGRHLEPRQKGRDGAIPILCRFWALNGECYFL